MGNPILDKLNAVQQSAMSQNSPMQMVQQFAQFKQQLRGQDPRAVVNQLLQSGRMSPQQFEQLKQQASALQSILK